MENFQQLEKEMLTQVQEAYKILNKNAPKTSP